MSFVAEDPYVTMWGGELIRRDGIAVGQVTSAAFGATAALDFRVIFAPMVNDSDEAAAYGDAAAALFGRQVQGKVVLDVR